MGQVRLQSTPWWASMWTGSRLWWDKVVDADRTKKTEQKTRRQPVSNVKKLFSYWLTRLSISNPSQCVCYSKRRLDVSYRPWYQSNYVRTRGKAPSLRPGILLTFIHPHSAVEKIEKFQLQN